MPLLCNDLNVLLNQMEGEDCARIRSKTGILSARKIDTRATENRTHLGARVMRAYSMAKRASKTNGTDHFGRLALRFHDLTWRTH